MKVIIDYEKLKAYFPNETQAALADFRKSRSKYKNVALDELEFAFDYGIMLTPYTFAEILAGVPQKNKSKKADESFGKVSGIRGGIACYHKNSKNSRMGYCEWKIIPFEVFQNYYPENSEKEYKKYRAFKNFL